MLIDGFAVNPANQEVSMEAHKYLNNFLEMPFVLVVFLDWSCIGFGRIFINVFRKSKTEFGFQELGQFLPFGCYFLMQVSIIQRIIHQLIICKIRSTIYNSSSSEFTLRTMSYVSLLVPFVLAYIALVWKKLDAKNISEKI